MKISSILPIFTSINKTRWFTILLKPYPLSTLRQALINVAIISLFIACFLIVFEPFGLAKIHEQRIPLILKESLAVFAVLMINVLFRTRCRQETWPVYSQILWLLWNLVSVSLVISIFISWHNDVPWDIWTWIQYQLFTLSIGVIPICVSVVLRYNRLLRQHLQEAEYLTNRLAYLNHSPLTNKPPGIVTLASVTGKEQLKLAVEELLFIESVGNYVEIHWQRGGETKKNLLRNTMAQMEMQLASQPQLFRCHRAYLVNLAGVESVKGNSHGYTLTFPNISTQLPVARSKVTELLQRLS